MSHIILLAHWILQALNAVDCLSFHAVWHHTSNWL